MIRYTLVVGVILLSIVVSAATGRVPTGGGIGGGSQIPSSIVIGGDGCSGSACNVPNIDDAFANNVPSGLPPNGTYIGTLSTILSSGVPPFSGSYSILNSNPSGGHCTTGPLDGLATTHFQIASGDQLQYNTGATVTSSYNICVQALSGSNSTTQEFTVAVHGVRNASLAASGCAGSGTIASPWNYLCIQNAVNSAITGDTVFLSGGNWRLDTGDATYVSINKAVTLLGAGSGNTFDSYGHINNAGGVTQCPTSGTNITCVYQTGPSYASGAATTPAGFIRIGLDGGAAPNCVNETVAHIFFDGSTTTAGGDYEGTLAFENCPGPITMSDIRFLTYGNPTVNPETQLYVQLSTNILIKNSMMANPLVGGSYNAGQAFESVANSGIMLTNNYFWQGVYNPTDDDNVTFSGNYTDMTQAGFDPAFGVSGCGLNPGNIAGHACPASGGLTGTFHATFANNYNNGGSLAGMSIGSAVNDPTTNGNVSDLHFTGNWVVGSTVSIDSCVWRIFADQGNCTSGGMSINAQANSSCVLSNNGNTFAITNNSLVGSTAAELNAQATGTMVCYDTANPGGITVNLEVFGFSAQNNYLSSPSNQYNTNTNTIGPVQSGNFCTSSAGTVSGCATSGFTTAPTISFTFGNLYNIGGTHYAPFASTNFTAQYGAVQWLASTSSATPTSGGQAGTGAAWSYTPPAWLAGVAHGNIVYLWVMDSANHISAPASAIIP